MKKILFLIPVLVSFAFGTVHIVSPGNSLHDTINNAAIGDTVELRNGPAVYTLNKTFTYMKKKVALISYTNDTIEKALSFYPVLTLNGDSCTVMNCNLRWRDSTASTGETMGIITSNNYGGHFIYGNKFTRPSSVTYSAAKGLYISRTDSTVTVPPTIFRKNYCDSVRIWFGVLYNNMPNNVTVDSNVFVNSRCNIGEKGVFRWNYCFQGGDFNMFGDSLLVEWNYGGSFYSGEPEYFGNDDNNSLAYGCVVRYNYLDSLAHNTVWDGTIDFEFNNNTIRNSMCSYYNHNTGTIDSSKNVRIWENWMSGTSNAQYIGFFTTGVSSDIRMTRNTFHGQEYTPIQMNALILNDTIDSCVFRYTVDVTNFDVKNDNAVVNIVDYVLDTNKYQFIKQNVASNPLRYSNGRRVTPKEYLTYLYDENSTSSSISFACSLSTQFRYGGRSYSTGRVNAWLYGDTAQVVVEYTTDTTGSISSVNADTLSAGENVALSVSSLDPSTEYFYRTISNGLSSEAVNIHDTTLWYSVTTLGGSTPDTLYDTFDLTSNVNNMKEAATIVVHPADDSVAAGEISYFTIQATGTTLSYQWVRNGSNVGSNSNIYSFTTSSANNGDSIWCIVSADTGSAATSNKAYLEVTGTTTAYHDLFMGHSMMDGAVPYYYELNHAHRTYKDQAVGGSTFTEDYARLDSNLTAFLPTFFFIWAGYNDFGSITDSATFDAAVDTYFTTWTQMVADLKASTVDSIYIVGLSPVSLGLTEQRARNYKRFNARLMDSCETNNLWFIDVYDSLCTPGTDSLNPIYTTDGVHPNGTTAGAEYCAYLFTTAYIPYGVVPVITEQPRDTTVNDGSVATFTISATNATGYQWYGNGSLISGATNSTYSFTGTLALSGSSIYCMVYNATDTISSDTVTLTVNIAPKTPATITQQPVSDTVTAGQSATFFVTATGSGLTYQWYRNDSLVTGATNDTFTYTSRTGLSYVDNVYCALATDTTVNSDTVTLTVISIPLPVISQSTDTLILTCTASGYDSLRWFHNGIPTDSTGLTYTIYADSAWYASKSVYYVMAYNVGGATKSDEWVFGTSSTGSRRSGYRQINMGQGMH